MGGGGSFVSFVLVRIWFLFYPNSFAEHFSCYMYVLISRRPTEGMNLVGWRSWWGRGWEGVGVGMLGEDK